LSGKRVPTECNPAQAPDQIHTHHRHTGSRARNPRTANRVQRSKTPAHLATPRASKHQLLKYKKSIGQIKPEARVHNNIDPKITKRQMASTWRTQQAVYTQGANEPLDGSVNL
jgi:hypothetical protein